MNGHTKRRRNVVEDGHTKRTVYWFLVRDSGPLIGNL